MAEHYTVAGKSIPQITTYYGIFLILWGISVSVISKSNSPTSFLPSLIGIPLLISGILATKLQESFRTHQENFNTASSTGQSNFTTSSTQLHQNYNKPSPTLQQSFKNAPSKFQHNFNKTSTPSSNACIIPEQNVSRASGKLQPSFRKA